KKKADELKGQLENLISSLIDFDRQHGVIERVAEGVNTPQVQFALFNIRQDVLEFKTPVRTIKLRYEKAIPLNDFEKTLLEKLIALYEHSVDIKKKIKELRRKINKMP